MTTVKCPYCSGKVKAKSMLVHERSCPAERPKKVRTKNDMLELLGSGFTIEEESE